MCFSYTFFFFNQGWHQGITSFVRVSFTPWYSSLTISLVFLLLVKSTASFLRVHKQPFEFTSRVYFPETSLLQFCCSVQVFVHHHYRKTICISLLGIPQHLIVQVGCQPPYTLREVIVSLPGEGQPLTTLLYHYCLGKGRDRRARVLTYASTTQGREMYRD